jgi:3-deoxy-D-manno-octulosonic-acid transferase
VRALAQVCSAVPLTRLERAYGLVAPLVFRAVQQWERLGGANEEELQWRNGLTCPVDHPVVWFHGASAGEMSAALALRQLLCERGFTFNAVYTAANRAGVEYIRRSSGRVVAAGLIPWDTRETLTRVFERWRPRMLFLVETELWPALIYEAWIRNIPVFCVSARIYLRDVNRYRLIKQFFRPTLQRITRIIAQDEVECRRFQEIGAPADLCVSGGNLKHLNSHPTVGQQALATELGIRNGELVLVVGSVHQDEATGLLRALRSLKVPNLRIVVAPRHLGAVDFVMVEASRLGWKVARRSRISAGWEVLVVDSIGELKRLYTIASCVVVGGGFGKHGGHNPFEPVMAGAPVIFGRHFENFQAEVRALTAATRHACVAEISQVAQVLTAWLADGPCRKRDHALQRAVIPDGKAIADRYLEVLAPWLSAINA